MQFTYKRLLFLQVDGAIRTNSRDINNNNGGGSGGSILIHTQVLSGGHTGIIQSHGGKGTAGAGGGSGGRIAVYYSNNDTHHPYRGKFDTTGGSATSGAEAGAAGTVYLKHTGTGFSTLRVDNNGQRSLDDEIPNGGRLLDLSGGSASRSQTYTAPNGVTVTSSCGLYPCYSHGCYSCQVYAIAHLFDQSLSTSSCDSYLSNCQYTRLTFDLKKSLFINHIRLYPYCSGARPQFRVSMSVKASYYSTVVTFHRIRASERAKYAGVLHWFFAEGRRIKNEMQWNNKLLIQCFGR